MKAKCTSIKLHSPCKLTAKIESTESLAALATLYEHAGTVADLLLTNGCIDEETADDIGYTLTALLEPVWIRVAELTGCALSEERF